MPQADKDSSICAGCPAWSTELHRSTACCGWPWIDARIRSPPTSASDAAQYSARHCLILIPMTISLYSSQTLFYLVLYKSYNILQRRRNRGALWARAPRFCNKQRSALIMFRNCPFSLIKKPSLKCRAPPKFERLPTSLVF